MGQRLRLGVGKTKQEAWISAAKRVAKLAEEAKYVEQPKMGGHKSLQG
jgi:hypothetical protein